MRWCRKKSSEIKDEYDELQGLLGSLKGVWDNYEQFLNTLDDEEMMEQWTYKVLIQKQLYRYIYRLVRGYYKGGDSVAKHVYYINGNNNFDHST